MTEFLSNVSFTILFGSLRLAGKLPLALRARLGALLGALFSYLPTRDRAVCEAQLRTFLGPSAGDYVRAVYANLGRTAAECLNLEPLLSTPELFSFPEEDQARKLVQSGRPLICLTGHIGNWDLFGALMQRRGFNVTAIGREARSPLFQRVLAALRDSYGIQTIWRTSSAQGAREILRALKAGRWVAALIDQDTRVAGIHVPFFGTPAATPSSLVDLALRQNAVVVSAFLVRKGNGGEVSYREHLSATSSEEVLSAYHAHLEEVIRSAPHQWVWVHKRWRTTTSGLRLSSREYLARLSKAALTPSALESLVADAPKP